MAELKPGPAPTGRDKLFDALYGALGGTPDKRWAADKLATALDYGTLGMLTGAYDGGRELAETGRPASLAMALMPGAKGAKLPMDFASRMARAEAMGFRLNPVYHGTATGPDGKIFSEFDPARVGGRTSGSQAGQEGVSVALNPEVANEFAMLAAQKSGGNPAVMPLLHRTERPAAMNLDGTEKNLEVAATLSEAFNEGGRDAVALKNYTTPGGKTGEIAVVLKNPNQLRSVNAEFDPARAHEADLMASRLLPFAVGGGLFGMYGDD